MAVAFGGESDQWCIVLIVIKRDGSLVLVVEPTRQAVPCPKRGELSRQHSRYDRPARSALARSHCASENP